MIWFAEVSEGKREPVRNNLLICKILQVIVLTAQSLVFTNFYIIQIQVEPHKLTDTETITLLLVLRSHLSQHICWAKLCWNIDKHVLDTQNIKERTTELKKFYINYLRDLLYSLTVCSLSENICLLLLDSKYVVVESLL